MLVIDDSWAAASNWRLRQEMMAEVAAQAAQSDREIYLVTTAPQAIPTSINPVTGEELRNIASNFAPTPFAADRDGTIDRLVEMQESRNLAAMDVRWLSDGIAGTNDAAFHDALKTFGPVSIFAEARSNVTVLRLTGVGDDGPEYQLPSAFQLSVNGKAT